MSRPKSATKTDGATTTHTLASTVNSSLSRSSSASNGDSNPVHPFLLPPPPHIQKSEQPRPPPPPPFVAAPRHLPAHHHPFPISRVQPSFLPAPAPFRSSSRRPIYISSDSEPEPEPSVAPQHRHQHQRKRIRQHPNRPAYAMAPASASSGGSPGPSSRRTSGRVKASAPPAPAAPSSKASTSSRAAHQSEAAAGNATTAAAASSSGGRSLRPRRESVGLYEISSDSSDGKGSDSEHQDEDHDDEEEEEDEEEGEEQEENKEPVKERAERGVGSGRSLRPRGSLAAPAGLADYVDSNTALSNRKRTTKKRKSGKKKHLQKRLPAGKACQACRDARRRCDRKKPRCGGCVRAGVSCVLPDAGDPNYPDEVGDGDDEGEYSVRTEIRMLLEETKRKRDEFYIKYRDLYEPLLPEKNYIAKLAEKRLLESASNPDVTMKDSPQIPVKAESNVTGEPNSVKTEAPVNGVKLEDGNAKFEVEVRDNVKAEDDQKERVETIKYPEVVPYELLDKQPKHVKATMKPYQLSGLSYLLWLYRNGASGILGDEMGLGKTLQTLSLFSYLTTYEPVPAGHQRPFLVVCPLSVLSSWIAECKKWTPHLRVLRFHGPTTERARLKKVAETGELFGADDSEGEGRGYDVVVTSYEVFEREKAWFRRAFVWRYVALDEGHKIKNDKTNIALALQGLAAEYRLILTGTPLQNNLTELWALLHWLYPDVFTEQTMKLFSDAFDLTLGKNDLSVMDNARKLLELVMLRRMKESIGVNLGLPTKTEVIMFLPLTPMQRFWYKRLLTRLDKGLLEGVFANSKEKVQQDPIKTEDGIRGEHIVNDQELEELEIDQWGDTKKIVEQAVAESTSSDGKWRKLMNLLMQLRKCCDHPYLLPNAEPESVADHSATIMLASSKMIFLDKLIDELCMNQGKKVLIFSGFTKMLDVCEDFLHLKGGDGSKFKFGRLDGTTPRARRNLGIRLFNNDPNYKVMLISTRAGGLGINLASASDVVMLESDWNPQADLQAQARAHRIGQVNPVTIYRLITQGTVEEQMMGRIRKKLYLSAKVTEAMRDIHTQTSSAGLNGDTEDNLPTLSTNQLMALVRSGSRAIARPEIDPTEMLQWDWETTIQKCRDYQEKMETENKEGISDETAEEERRWLSEMERVETRVFEGKRHEKSTDSNKDIAKDWARSDRRMGMERVVMVDGHPVLKETIGNDTWEAVATFAGKDPRLAEPPKRKRKAIEHQDYCQICFNGGTLHTCSGCPRVYHDGCLPEDFQPRLKGSKVGHFYCPQHECVECQQKTVNAGGLIFRCRWCENGYCEDCLNWEQTELIGESLPELDLLNFGPIEQAFWIKCEHCIHLHTYDIDSKALCEEKVKAWEAEKERRDAAPPELTMDGTTVQGSEVATPVDEMPALFMEDETAGKKRRRKTVDSYAPPKSAKKAKTAKTPKKAKAQ